jgi:hypothetical protein
LGTHILLGSLMSTRCGLEILHSFSTCKSRSAIIKFYKNIIFTIFVHVLWFVAYYFCNFKEVNHVFHNLIKKFVSNFEYVPPSVKWIFIEVVELIHSMDIGEILFSLQKINKKSVWCQTKSLSFEKSVKKMVLFQFFWWSSKLVT